MRLVIATGIYPPEAGGPAYYAEGLASSLRDMGHDVRVVTYGALKSLPTGLRHVLYGLKLAPSLIFADAVIALDTFSVALPAVLLSKLFGTRIVVRTGGDFLWDSYLERTHDLLPLPEFYKKHQPLTSKEEFIFSATRFVARHAGMIFSTEMQRNVWQEPYSLDSVRTHIIANAADAPLQGDEPMIKNFLWHVRPIVMKNGEHVRAAFKKAQEGYPDIVLSEGILPKEQLLARMKSCYAVILPSLTEISPNYILDALRFKKPFIIDKYSGFAEWLAPYGTVVDPLDEDDIARAIATFASPEGYKAACARSAGFSFVRGYDEVARDFISLLKKQ